MPFPSVMVNNDQENIYILHIIPSNFDLTTISYT